MSRSIRVALLLESFIPTAMSNASEPPFAGLPALAMSRLAKNPATRLEMARAGGERASRKFSECRYLAEIDRLYRGLLAQ